MSGCSALMRRYCCIIGVWVANDALEGVDSSIERIGVRVRTRRRACRKGVTRYQGHCAALIAGVRADPVRSSGPTNDTNLTKARVGAAEKPSKPSRVPWTT